MPLPDKVSRHLLPSCSHVHDVQSPKPLHKVPLIQSQGTRARLAFAAAVFVALVLITVGGGHNPSQHKCRRQIKKQNLTQFEQYLVEREQQLQGQEYLLKPEQKKKKHLRPCCEQVEKLDTKCWCMGLEQIVEQLRERGELQVEEVEDMEDSARRLPLDCDLEPRSCKF